MMSHGQVTVQAGTPMTVTGKGTLSCMLGQGVDMLSFTFFCLKLSSGVRGQTAPGWFSQHERLV